MKQMWLIGSLSHSLKIKQYYGLTVRVKHTIITKWKLSISNETYLFDQLMRFATSVSCDFAVQIWPNSLLNRLLSFQEGAFSTFEEFAALINSPIDYCSSQSSPVFLHQNYYPILSSAHCRSHYEKSCYQRSHHAQLNSVAWKYSCRRCRISSLFRKPA